MKIQTLNMSNKKRILTFILLLFFLTFSYILVSYIEARATFSSESKFTTLLKDMEICLGGEAVGIKILSTGVLVVGIDNTSSLSIGDIILEINGVQIDTNDALIEEVQKAENKDNISLKVNRNGEIISIPVKATYSNANNTYELGLWVKDSSAGVGTISFYDKKKNTFAALGHGITETSNNVIIPINSGGIVKTKITEITKGARKAPRRYKRNPLY